MTTADMIDTCFRHQHPEAYGREPIWEGYGTTVVSAEPAPTASADSLPEEPMGHPDAIPL
jgi:hypothetical protein